MTDEELARFHRGEEDLFRRLVNDHSPRLLAVARSFAKETQEAHDLVQETWLRAWARRTTYSGRGPILSWLYSVCRSVCLSRVRATRGFTGVGNVDGGAEPPDRAVVREEVSRAVRQALMELPERQRAVVICRILEGRSTRETAQALGCAEGTVKATLHQGLRGLAPHLRSWQD